MSRKIRTRICIGDPPRRPEGDHSDPTYRDREDDWFDDYADWKGMFEHFVEHANFRDRLWFAFTRQAWITCANDDDPSLFDDDDYEDDYEDEDDYDYEEADDDERDD